MIAGMFTNYHVYKKSQGFSSGSVVKNLPASAGDVGSVSGWGRCPGKGNGNPHQYSCLDNFMDGSLLGSLDGFKELDMTED